MKSHLVRFCLVPVLTALASGAEAEEPTAIPNIAVTANRVETPTAALGSSVTVITADQLQRRQDRYVADALRRVPGLAVSRTGGAGHTTAVRMRGMEAHHTLVMINGVEVADLSAAQQSFDFGHLPTTDIERIEIVRGPQSTLYGSDAIGGVINIITKEGRGAPKITASAELGSYQTKRLGSAVSGKTGDLAYAVDIAHHQTDGFSVASENNGNSERDGYRNTNLNGRIGYDVTETFSVNGTVRVMDSHLEYDDWSNGTATDDDDNMRKRERSLKLGADWSVFDGALVNSFGASRNLTRRDVFEGKEQTNFYDGTKGKYDYQGVLSLHRDHKLVFGGESESEHAQTDGGVDRTLWHKAGFADLQGNVLNSDLSYTLGARFDDHALFGDHWTYRSTLAYFVDATDTKFHGSYGTGFRAPSLFELSDSTYGNADLTPEESRGWDVGVEQSFWDEELVLDVTFFNNRTRNLVTFVWPSGYSNIRSSRAFGVETALTAELWDKWSLTGSYTYTEARNNSTGRALARRPNHEANLILGWEPMDGLTTDLSMRSVGRNYDSATGAYLGGYTLWGLNASYRLDDALSISGRIENLTDKQYEEVDTYGTPGRSAYVGLTAIF